MRKSFNLFLFLSLSTVFTSFAQFESGKTLLGVSSLWGSNGANSGFSASSLKFKSDDVESESTKSFNLNISPRIGRMFTKDVVFGIELNYNYNKADNASFDGGEVRTNQIGAGPFLRYYIPSGKIRPIIEAGCSFGSSKAVFENTNSEDFELKQNTFSYGGGAGLAFPLGDFASFDTLLIYNYFQSKAKEDNTNNSRNINSVVGLRLGFSIYLGKSQTQNNSQIN